MYHPERIFQRRQAAIDATGEDSIEEISIEVDIGENRGMYKNILKNNRKCYQIPIFYFPKISKNFKKKSAVLYPIFIQLCNFRIIDEKFFKKIFLIIFCQILVLFLVTLVL